MKNKRKYGKSLDKMIVLELELMLKEGLDNSPISASALHKRLLLKNIVSGGLSTFSKSHRKELIANYKKIQLDNARVSDKARLKQEKGQKINYYKQRYFDILDELKIAKEQLASNTAFLMELIILIETTTTIQVEKILTPYLIENKQKI